MAIGLLREDRLALGSMIGGTIANVDHDTRLPAKVKPLKFNRKFYWRRFRISQ
ncbi:hypothetical protein [Bradyrhizobium sp. Ai1a-2]|uniref:hypothetical protein n=1 Tax=Bradyrhizobium sp. Ai1a-2 TaxID=196490 RepID=UPI0004275EB5|nr:hypothetical protein [Bradyrhizobium sp. Ai1a-2]